MSTKLTLSNLSTALLSILSRVNVASTFTAKQTFNGSASQAAVNFANITERANIVAAAATGTINLDATTASVWWYTSNNSANWTINVRGSSGTTLNTLMATGDILTVAFISPNGSSAFYPNTFQIDGTTITPLWQGGVAPTGGDLNATTAYTYSILKTGSAAYTVLASQVKFA